MAVLRIPSCSALDAAGLGAQVHPLKVGWRFGVLRNRDHFEWTNRCGGVEPGAGVTADPSVTTGSLHIAVVFAAPAVYLAGRDERTPSDRNLDAWRFVAPTE